MESENYGKSFAHELDRLSGKHEEKMNSIEKEPSGFLLKFAVAASFVLSFAGWIALAMVPTPYVDLLDATCIFVISFVVEYRAMTLGNSAEEAKAMGPKQHLGEILVHNTIIGKDIREIKNLLAKRGQ